MKLTVNYTSSRTEGSTIGGQDAAAPAFALTPRDMERIGAYACQLIRERCARAENLADEDAMDLSEAYARRKIALGRPDQRDMMLTGSMLGSMTSGRETDHSCELGFSRQAEANKAQWNQNREPWFGISHNDSAPLGRFIASIFDKRFGK